MTLKTIWKDTKYAWPLKKLYGNLQSLPVFTYYSKNLLIDFITGLQILTDWKRDNYNSILVIINRFTKMVYYKSVKITIDAPGFIEIIVDIVVKHYSLLDSIVTNRGLLFNLKFWSLLCYFFGIKRRLLTTFYY